MKTPQLSKFKIYLAVTRAMLYRGLSDRRADEFLLQKVLRETADHKLFDLAAFILGRFGTIFSLPTLMAFRDSADLLKQKSVVEALIELLQRVNPLEIGAPIDLFKPEYWHITWETEPERFLTFVACIGQLYDSERFLEPEFMDEIASTIMKEVSVNFRPYHNFANLRLMTSPEMLERDIHQLNTIISQDMLVRSVTDNGAIDLNEEQQTAENMLFMRCDYLLTRLKLPGDFQQNLYMLKALFSLNDNL